MKQIVEKNVKKIEKMLGEIKEEAKRIEITKTFDACIKAIGCETVNWKEFYVYESSEDVIKDMLLAMEPQYIMLICEQMKMAGNEERNVKICVISDKKEEDVQVWSTKGNLDILLAMVEISPKVRKYLREKAKTEE